MDPINVKPENAEKLHDAQCFRKLGWSYSRIAIELDVSKHTILRWLVPSVREANTAKNRQYVAAYRERPISPIEKLPPANLVSRRDKITAAKAEMASRMAPAAKEFRDKTAQAFGDPLHVRSAAALPRSAGYQRKPRPIVPYETEIDKNGHPMAKTG